MTKKQQTCVAIFNRMLGGKAQDYLTPDRVVAAMVAAFEAGQEAGQYAREDDVFKEIADKERERDMRCVVCCRESGCRELYVRRGFRCEEHTKALLGDPRHDPVSLDAPDAPANPEQGAR